MLLLQDHNYECQRCSITLNSNLIPRIPGLGIIVVPRFRSAVLNHYELMRRRVRNWYGYGWTGIPKAHGELIPVKQDDDED